MKKEFDLFSKFLGYFFHVVEKELSYAHGNLEVPAWLPYSMMQALVEKTYKSCGAILAEFPNLPTQHQKDAMTDVLRYGLNGDSSGEYSLVVNFSPEHYNSTFVSCFNEGITKGAGDYFNGLKTGTNYLVIGFIVLAAVAVVAALVVAVSAFAVACYRCMHTMGGSAKSAAAEGGIFSVTNSSDAESSQTEDIELLGDRRSASEGVSIN